MNYRQRDILRHALGLTTKGTGTSYRNYFVTGHGSADFADCEALVASGHMTKHKGGALMGGDDIFVATDAGKFEAKVAD